MLTMTLSPIRRMLSLGRRGAPGAVASQSTRPAPGEKSPDSNLIFRLKAWPQLPESGRTAETYRMLSVMSSQPVNRQWLLARFRMAPRQLDAFLQQLIAQGALEVIDTSRFSTQEAARA